MLKLVVSLSRKWVLDHRSDEIRPIEYVEKIVGEHFQGKLTVDRTGHAEIVLNVSCDEAVAEQAILMIRKLFSEYYSLDENNDVFSAQVVEEQESEEQEPEEKPDEGQQTEESGESKKQPSKDSLVKQTGAKKTHSVDECIEKIDDLVGAKEFKALAHEIVDIAPQLVEHKTYDILNFQSYLFSINEGHGLSTYLSSMAELFESLNLPNISSIDIIEESIRPRISELVDPFENLKRLVTRPRSNTLLLCLDICEWMNKLHDREFRSFLMLVCRNMSKLIVVFRIPFVDKEVLHRVSESLGDLMFVRTVSFAPFDKAELQACAEAELKKYNFTIEDDAWDGFHGRIAEEKRDGKFYGINTVKKVVRDLLYKKQLKNARGGDDHNNISVEDASRICASLSESTISGHQMLERMVGGEGFKKKIDEIVAQIKLALRTPDVEVPCIHMRFVGNPGTGKTTVARIVGKILKENGILRIGGFFECSGRDLCGRYVGETAPKTSSACRDAYGSVLFIDEAYSLYRGTGGDADYGREALDTLIAEMENHRSDLVVIMAGYTDEMNTLMEGNAGLASRMPYVIEFPNFTREQLYEIFLSMMGGQFDYDEKILPAVREYFMSIPDAMLNSKEFSNARFVRNLFERTWAKASMRCQLEKLDTITLIKDDFVRASSDKEFSFEIERKSKIGFVK